jgi:hypothetical protein
MKLIILAVAAALIATPAAAQRSCLSDAEAESLATVILPDVIRETGRLCQSRLPARSLLRRTDGPLIAKYQAAADRAWPAAQQAIVKLSDPAVTLLLASEYARPVLSSLIAPQIVGRIAVADCPVIDRLVTLLEPLPPANTAGVIVTAIRADQAKRGQRRPSGPELPLCPAS